MWYILVNVCGTLSKYSWSVTIIDSVDSRLCCKTLNDLFFLNDVFMSLLILFAVFYC